MKEVDPNIVSKLHELWTNKELNYKALDLAWKLIKNRFDNLPADAYPDKSTDSYLFNQTPIHLTDYEINIRNNILNGVFGVEDQKLAQNFLDLEEACEKIQNSILDIEREYELNIIEPRDSIDLILPITYHNDSFGEFTVKK